MEASSAQTVEDFVASTGVEEYFQPDAAPSPEPAEPADPAATTESPTPDASPEPDAAEPAADPSVPVDDAIPDPTPFSYKTDGQEKVFEGIHLHGELGAIVDASAVPQLQKWLGEREHLFTANQKLYADQQRLERLSEWRQTGADGKEEILTGQQGAEAMRLAVTRQAVEISVYESLFEDPSKLVNLLAQDQNGAWVLDPERLNHLALQARVQMRDAEDSVRKELNVRMQPPAPTLNVAQHAPGLIDQITGADRGLLSPDDRALLTEALAQYVRDALPGEPNLHGKTVRPEYGKLVASFVEKNRHAKASVATVAQTSSANAAKLLAAKTTLKTPTAPKKPQPTPDARDQDASDLWDMHERSASRALRASR